MKAKVNGDEWELPDGASIGDVMRRLGAPTAGIAVAHEGALVPRASWPDTPVKDGDSIEVLTAVQGG
jgi:sulfur carrier protein